MLSFKLSLVSLSEETAQALREAFVTEQDVEIYRKDFREVPGWDCLVSPANSYGLMDGGMDYYIAEYFPRVQEAVQFEISNRFYGEQPVGTSLIVATHNADHPWLAHTPTMRVPMRITQTDNIYNAMRAMMIAVETHNDDSPEFLRIKHVLCPALGAGAGGMPPRLAAHQMWVAYQKMKLTAPEKPNWRYAEDWQNLLGRGRGGDLEDA